MNDNQESMQNEFSLTDLFYILLNNIRTIVISTIFFGLLAGVYAYTIAQEEYVSDVDVYITPVTEDVSSSDYSTARYLIMTIGEYMESNTVIDTVIENLGLDLSRSAFTDKLTVTASTDSFRINVSYQDPDPALTTAVVNELVSVSIDMQENENSGEQFLPDSIKLVGILATEDGSYASPNKILILIIGLFLGGIIGVGVAFIREMINNSFKTKEQLEQAFDIQVLGIIPEFIIKEDF
jgi:capsular polysaccharide biosynthesis protein